MADSDSDPDSEPGSDPDSNPEPNLRRQSSAHTRRMLPRGERVLERIVRSLKGRL
jgi:hypothetical protein